MQFKSIVILASEIDLLKLEKVEPINIYKCQTVQVRITTRPIVKNSLTFFITIWFKGNIVIVTMYKFTNVTGGKQQPQTQHDENVLHHKVCPPSQM
jgi:hypothetical protein